jgi:hypothetical protein
MRAFLSLFLTLSVVCEVFAQVQSASVITAAQYSDAPRDYLTPIANSKISSGILIDRAIFQDLIGNVNGASTVTSINSSDFFTMYDQIRKGLNDTTMVESLGVINDLISEYRKSFQAYSFGIMDFKFNRINASALSTGQLTQGTSTIVDNGANSTSFSNERAIFASPLTQNITGDAVRFILSDFFYNTNVTGKRVKKVEIDFGNGEGYKIITFNDPIDITYSSTSGFVSLITKLTLEDISTLATEGFYAHSSVFHTGSETVPLPDPVYSQSNSGGRMVFPARQFSYPDIAGTVNTNHCARCGRSGNCCIPIYTDGAPKLDVYIDYSSSNTTQKLRRPIIVVEGFDPGNQRDYYTKIVTSVDQYTPRTNDTRGLRQLLNGDPSPWYPNVVSPNMVQSLLDAGFDIVYINFRDGEGDIRDNGTALRGLLNDVLNSPAFRDNLTEEAVLVGASMGGLVTRYALNTMEAANEQHYVRRWYTMDTPHQGAAIPLALQYSVNWLQYTRDVAGLISKITWAKSQFESTTGSLNSVAARQMVLQHFFSTTTQGNPDPLFTQFYGELGNTVPKFSWNTSVSMGGLNKLYSNTSDIIDFKLKVLTWNWVWGRGNTNSSASQKIWEGHRGVSNPTGWTSNQISFENAPGGFNTALYALNVNSGNKNHKHDVLDDPLDINYNWFTFMVTTSTFDIPVTTANVFNTWQAYATANGIPTDSRIPFDRVKGMANNEEHVTISPSTATWFLGDLHDDFVNTSRPYVKTGKIINQIVSKPVAYTAKTQITFGGNNNSISFESTANVSVNTGNTIRILPGVIIKQGATFHAKITTINDGTLNTGRSISGRGTKAVNLLEKSPFLHQVFDYSTKTGVEKIDIDLSIVVHPNPTDNLLNVVAGGRYSTLRIDIYNSIGYVMPTFEVANGVSRVLDVTSYASGIYIAKVSDELGHEKSVKFARK